MNVRTLLNLLALVAVALPVLMGVRRWRLERIGQQVPFSNGARDAMRRAEEMAASRGHGAVEEEHVALAILQTAAYQHLGSSTTPLAHALDAMRGAPGAGERPPERSPERPPLSARLHRTMAEAVRMAVAQGVAEAQPEHLLHAILRRQKSRTAMLLAAGGVTTDVLRLRDSGTA